MFPSYVASLPLLTCLLCCPACLQGFGNVGSWAAQILHEQGGRVVAVSDVNGAIVDPSGLDIPELRRHVDEYGHSLASFPDGERW